MICFKNDIPNASNLFKIVMYANATILISSLEVFNFNNQLGDAQTMIDGDNHWLTKHN